MEGIFSRQEALKLSGLSSGQLSRLDKAGVVEPVKLGSESHPTVLYTLDQVRELRIIAALRQKLSMQETKKVIDYIRKHDFDRSLLGKFLIFYKEKLYWIASEQLSDKIIELSGKNRGQAVIKAVHPIGDVLSELQDEVSRREKLDAPKTSKKAFVEA